MKVAYATIFIFVLWLIVSTPYWKTSHRVSHTLWKGFLHCCYKRTYEDKLQTKLVPPFFHASPYWNLLYTIKTHRLKQNCVCILINRNHTNCLPLINLYKPNISHPKQFYLQNSALDMYTGNHKNIYTTYTLYTNQLLNATPIKG